MIAQDIVRSTSDQGSKFRLPPNLTLSALVAISVAVWWRALASTLALALHNDQYTHILLILPISVALISMGWESTESSTGVSLSVGSSLLGAAILVAVATRFRVLLLQTDAQLSLSMLALVVWWMGTFIVCFGTRTFRRALFPLCFLFWMVPIPQFLLSPIVSLLQQGSVTSAHLLFTAVGVPVSEDGTLLTIPSLTVEVARECSSIRSSLMLVVATMVLAQTLLRSTWQKTLVIALAIPLSVAKNGLRIVVLAMLATRVDRSFLTGRLHHEGGVIYFSIALAAIFLLIWLARRGEQKFRAVDTMDS